MVVLTVTLVFKGTVEDEAMLAVMLHKMVGDVTRFTHLGFFLKGKTIT